MLSPKLESFLLHCEEEYHTFLRIAALSQCSYLSYLTAVSSLHKSKQFQILLRVLDHVTQTHHQNSERYKDT